MTNTFVHFNYFMNTRAGMSLCYGPGVQESNASGHQVEFVIQARNDNAENRSSGRDEFKITITTIEDQPQVIESEILDRDDGSYLITYQVDEPCEVTVEVLFKNDKQKFVPLRGSPYKASFQEDVNPNMNKLIGPGIQKHVMAQIEQLQEFMKETTAGLNVKDKDLQDVKELIKVKDYYETVNNQGDSITL